MPASNPGVHRVRHATPNAGVSALQMGALESQKQKPLALVVPAFETTLYRFRMPASKKELLAMWDNGGVAPFRFEVWEPGHAPTDFDKWRTADAPYVIQWAEGEWVAVTNSVAVPPSGVAFEFDVFAQ